MSEPPSAPAIEPRPAPPAHPPSWAEVQARFPRFLDLQSKVISRSCSPNPGVCHASNNHPDLSSAANVLAALRQPCNLEMPDPIKGWDACERPADRIVAGDFAASIAWLEPIPSSSDWRVTMRDAPRVTESRLAEVESASGEVVVKMPGALRISLVRGTVTATLTTSDYQTPFRIVPGDPNRNGIFAAEVPDLPPARLIYPGSLEQSYLWRRITGTVPGSRMPLANQALSNLEYVAIACWIEGLAANPEPEPDDAIDYSRCRFAADQSHYGTSP
jgi:hypothetical protein